MALMIEGIVYQGSGFDPLVDNDQCQIDAGLMRALGVNTIKVYTVDGSRDHDACMQTFASQGIYVWLDLSSPTMSINRVREHFFVRLLS